MNNFTPSQRVATAAMAERIATAYTAAGKHEDAADALRHAMLVRNGGELLAAPRGPDMSEGNYCYYTNAHQAPTKHAQGDVFIVCKDDANKYLLSFRGTESMISSLNRQIGLDADQVDALIQSSIRADNYQYLPDMPTIAVINRGDTAWCESWLCMVAPTSDTVRVYTTRENSGYIEVTDSGEYHVTVITEELSTPDLGEAEAFLLEKWLSC